jgi:hypothetical protein
MKTSMMILFIFLSFGKSENDLSMVFMMAEELSIDQWRLDTMKSDLDSYKSADLKPRFLRKKRNESLIEIDYQIQELAYYLEIYSKLKSNETLELKDKPMIHSDLFLDFQLELSDSKMNLDFMDRIKTLQDGLEAIPDIKRLSNESIYRFQHLLCQLEEFSFENVNFLTNQLKIMERKIAHEEELTQLKIKLRKMIFDLAFNLNMVSNKYL